jgi:flagellar hook-associated protein 2
MAAITSLGVGSGLDLNSLVNNLVSLERRPIEQLQANQRALQGRVSSYGQIKSLFSTLQDAASRLTAPSLWSQTRATSGNDAAVGTTAAAGASSTAAGNYKVAVQRLASAQTVSSDTAFTSATETVGAGTLTLQLGRWNGSAFTADAARTAVDIEVGEDDTLQAVRDKINAAGAGVSASLVTDATGVRLVVRSTTTGADNGFRLSVAGAAGGDPVPPEDPPPEPVPPVPATGLARLAYAPDSGAGGMALKQAALNAQATIDGVAVESATNELSGAIEGVTLRLRQVTTADVDIDISPDREAVSTALKGLADAYNALTRYLGEQTRFDPASRTGGPLQGDSAANGLQQRLRGVISATTGASTAFPRLSDLGLELQRDGSVKINQAKVDAAMTKLPELRQALAATDSENPENTGLARRWSQLAQQVLAVDGTVSTRTEALQSSIRRIDTDKAKVEDRVERFRARLVAQYTAMDSNVARLNALNGALTQQLSSITRQNQN